MIQALAFFLKLGKSITGEVSFGGSVCRGLLVPGYEGTTVLVPGYDGISSGVRRY